MSAAPIAVPAPPVWRPATRAALRFCVVYFGLYILLTQMLTSLLFVTTNDSGAFEVDMTSPFRAAITWVAAHVFHVAQPLVTVETGSGDRRYDWIELACIAVLAVAGTLVWTLLDRKRSSYPRLFCWFHLCARFALGATLLTYGAVKIFPLQMPYPSLLRLLEPFGHFSPMGVLWASIGAAPAYEIFAGCAEFVAGTMLLFPRTATLGALLALADAAQVFMLNMTYDVPVKLLSFHMIPLALLVLAPDGRRLATALLSSRPAPPSPARALFATARANRWALAAQAAFALYLIGGNVYMSASVPARAKSPLYGIWEVQSFALDGVVHPPLLTDTARWRRVVFDSPAAMIVQTMDDTARGYPAAINLSNHSIALSKPGDKNWRATFTLTQPAPMDLELAGAMNGHRIAASLRLFDRSSLQLVRRGFHWIQDRPYNR
ncbi:MAG TPA: hypothetical protein VN690_11480 [Terriglobales bacterium]|nr:hypothetical protein [Terriglobales bacterium]